MEVNPFKPKTQEQILAEQNEAREIKSKVKGIAEMAARCLDNPDFKEYRRRFEEGRAELLTFMNDNVNPDPVQDAFMLRTAIAKLSVFETIINMIEKDSKRSK